MSRTTVTLVAAVLCLPVIEAQAETPAAAAVGLQPFRATYEVEYRGIGAGELVFTLREVDATTKRYEYYSKPRPSLLARIVVSREALESSVFALVEGSVQPRTYRLEDGRSATDDDARLDFDWSRGVVTGVAEDKSLEFELVPGMQDRMSIQIEVMADLKAGREPGTIAMIDGDRVKHYTYTRDGSDRIATPLGTFDTAIYSSTRPGSNRIARFWYAAELGYVPVRGEQIRAGKLETVMRLTQFGRID